MRRTKRKKRSLTWPYKIILASVVLSALPIALFRFAPPPVTGVMIERRIEAWLEHRRYKTRYNWVAMDKIAPAMCLAVIAAEDQRFLEHRGFDWDAIEKAIDHNMLNPQVRGGSTISQQTSKNLFLWSDRSWLRKGLEAYYTAGIELVWPKKRILEVYLNIVEFGDGIFGVEAAARTYFRKPAARLTRNEAALLAAVLPNPRAYHVSRPGDWVRQRRLWILDQMRRLGGETFLLPIRK